MEAALRTAYEWIAGVPLETLDLVAVRGLKGVKEAQVDIPNLGLVKVAVVNGLGNARKILEQIKSNEAEYHFVEIMACPGGCLGGGGQPRSKHEDSVSTKQARLESIYKIDRDLPLRRSHDNPAVKRLYAEYLGSIGGDKAHHLLHTTYVARGRFPWRNK